MSPSTLAGASLTATTADLRSTNRARALRTVHHSPDPLSRAELGRRLGCVRATTAALVADLEALGLVQEQAAVGTGRRGRPSAGLGPAPRGPVVVTLEIAPDAVRVAQMPVTGGLSDFQARPLAARDVDFVLEAARGLLHERLKLLGGRAVGVGVAMHGLVDRVQGTVLSAPGFGWDGEPVDVLGRLGLRGSQVLSGGSPSPVRCARIGNVATLTALGEAVRGAAREYQSGATVLVLHAGVGLGGALLVDGRPVTGRRGLAGEYGHAPFGTQNLLCRCGAKGCWETEVDRLALARMAGVTANPQDAEEVAARVLAMAAGDEHAAGDVRARDAVHRAAVSLGRGIGALVAVHDPDLVLLTAHAADLYAADPQTVRQALAASGARRGVPPIGAGALGADAGAVGAAESVFDVLLEDLSLLTTNRESR